jgi:hypothetical protein
MPRNMAFTMTIDAFKNRKKTVTRRKGWAFLKPGDEVNAVEKMVGRRKGEKVVSLGRIEVLSVRREPLSLITQDEVVKEGFPDCTPAQFIRMLVNQQDMKPNALVTRIEYKYL